jgi:hypothetical protein
MKCLRNMLVRFLKFGFRAFKALLGLLGLRSFAGKIVRKLLNDNSNDNSAESYDTPSNFIAMAELDDILDNNYAPEELIDTLISQQKLLGTRRLPYEFVSQIVINYYFKNKASTAEKGTSTKVKITNIKEISKPSEGFPEPTFSVSAATRFVNNVDHKLPTLLYCLYVNALAPENFEVLLGVDEDDDLEYFQFIQTIFRKKLNIKIIVGEANRGYRNLHHIQSDIMPHRSSKSAGVFSVTDDTCINKRYWDIEILSLVGSKPQEIYMAYPVPNQHATTHGNMDFSQFLALLATNGPRGFQFFFSSPLLSQLAKLTTNKPGWRIYGNNFLSDSYFDILAFLSLHDYHAPLLVPMNRIGYMFEQSLSDHKEGGLFGDSPVFKSSLPLLYHEETLKIIREIAQALAEKINTSSK